jgi:hypothetical protein
MDEQATCDVREHRCLCALAADHELPHECYCGGRWRGSSVTNDLEVVRWPQQLMETGEPTPFADDPDHNPRRWTERSLY